MPAAGHDERKRRPAHKRGVVARAAQRLFNGAPKQHHVVSGGQRVGGVKHRLDLAGAQLNFKRQQRQAQCLRGALHNAQRLVGHVGPLLRQQVVAGVNHRYAGRGAGPVGLHRVKLLAGCGIGQFVDMKLHLKPAGHAVACLCKPCQGGLQNTPGVKRNWHAIRMVCLALHPPSLAGP